MRVRECAVEDTEAGIIWRKINDSDMLTGPEGPTAVNKNTDLLWYLGGD